MSIPDLVQVLTPTRTYDVPPGLQPSDGRAARIKIGGLLFGVTGWRYTNETDAQLEQRVRDELAADIAARIRSGHWGDWP